MSSLVNLEGQQFGKWTVLSERRTTRRSTQWLCRCGCGKESFVYYSFMLRGTSKSCKSCSHARAFNYKPGQEVNGFIIVSRVLDKPYRVPQRCYKIKCLNCENEFVRPSNFLRLKKERTCPRCRSFSSRIGGPANDLYSTYRKAAEYAGRDFLLTPEQFKQLVIKDCCYCGQRPLQKKRTRTQEFFYNGVDRVDNNQGYTISNAVPCCKTCNMAKKIMSKEDFLQWVDRVHDYQHEPEPVTFAIGHD